MGTRNPKLTPAKKITRETLRENPLLAALARQRVEEQRKVRADDLFGRPGLPSAG